MPSRFSLIDLLVVLGIVAVLAASALHLTGCEALRSTEPMEQRLAQREANLDARIGVVSEVIDNTLAEGDIETADRAQDVMVLLGAARDEITQVRLDLEQARIEGPPEEVQLILGFLPPQVAAVAGTVFGIGAAGWQGFRRWQAILRAKSAEADVDSIIMGVEKAKAMDGEFKAKLKIQRPILIDNFTPQALKRIGELAG